MRNEVRVQHGWVVLFNSHEFLLPFPLLQCVVLRARSPL